MSIPMILGHHDALLKLEQEDDITPFVEGNDWMNLDLDRLEEADSSASFFACWVPQPSGLDDSDFWDFEDVEEDFFLDDDALEEGYDDSEDSEDSQGSLDDVPLADPIDPDYARDVVDSMILRLYELSDASQGRLSVVTDIYQLQECREQGTHGAILHFEGAAPLSGDFCAWLEHYYSLGLRSLGLVWSRSNEFATGVPFRYPSTPDTGPGLSAMGLDLVRACNELGVMVDLSHLNEEGFWDVARVSRHPLVATHSNAHALCPSARNLTDAQLIAIKNSGGIVGVNFCTSDLRDDGLDDEDTDFELVLDQIDYMVKLIGVSHVGLGTDYDGALVPSALSDVSYLPIVWELLSERGYSDEELRALAYGNWERVLAVTWQN